MNNKINNNLNYKLNKGNNKNNKNKTKMKEFRIVWVSQIAGQQDQVVARTESISKATAFFDAFKETASNLSGNLFNVVSFRAFWDMEDNGKTKNVKSAMSLSLIMVIDGKETELDFDDRIYYEQYDEDE